MIFPPDFTFPREKAEIAKIAAKSIATLAPARGVVVQAGGCSGLWPLALAKYFRHVYTCEPNPVNFECLEANVAARPNITAFPYALGEKPAKVGLTRTKPGAGLWRVDGDGEIPMMALDDVLGDAAVDAIVLDVEGFELPALQGATRTIAAHRPLLWFECLRDPSALHAFLVAHGYTRPKQGIGRDYYTVHASRVLH